MTVTRDGAQTMRRLLLAEDDPRDVDLTLRAFASFGLSNPVDVVHDGVECLEFLRAEGRYAGRSSSRPVVLLLDLKMPLLGGIETLAEIRGDPALRTLPVVMLTSSREESDLVRSYELGTNAYVVKPVGFQDFIDAIRALGSFWALVNEPPPGPGKAADGG